MHKSDDEDEVRRVMPRTGAAFNRSDLEACLEINEQGALNGQAASAVRCCVKM